MRYRPGGDNSVLLMVLHRMWKKPCYWCRPPKPFAEMDIDHLIPRTVTHARCSS